MKSLNSIGIEGALGDSFSILKQLQAVSEQSDDPDRKVGAIIYDVDGNAVVRSANILVTPKTDDSQRKTSRDRNQKYYWIEHAERHAILSALKQGINLTHCTIAVNLFPCADCARAIVQAGLRTVLAPQIPNDEPRHKETMQAAHEILKDAGIKVVYL